MKTDIQGFRTLVYAGIYDVMPLHQYDAMIPDKGGRLLQAGKRPLEDQWTKNVYDSVKVLADAEKTGRNLGVRLKATQLVVDVDPRNFGPTAETKDLPKEQWIMHTLDTKDNPFQRLMADCGMVLEDYPHVVTGSGGLHIYLTKPAKLSVKDTLKDLYPGIEYKSLGRQVVAPGSIHPDTHQHYVAVHDAFADFKAPPEINQKLSDLIGRSRTNQNRSERLRTASDGSGEDVRTTIDAGQIAKLLPWIAIPSGQGDYEDWIKFLMAANFASNADHDVFKELEAWCEPGANLQDRWQGFGQNDGPVVTFGTLARLALQYAKPEHKADVERWITETRAASDFAMIVGEAEILEADMAEITKDEDPADRTELTTDSPMELARAFSKRFPGHIRFEKSWLLYEASRGCYIELENEDELVKAPLWAWLAGRPYRAPGGEEKRLKDSITLVNNVLGALNAQSQLPPGAKLPSWRAKDLSRLPDPKDIIPLKNGLFHVPSRRLLPPTPMYVSVRTADVAYQPDATCPTFEAWVTQIFTPEDGPNAGIVDHECIQAVQEFMGYCLTTDTSIHKLLYLIGPSRSGKGTLLKIIEALVGEENVESPNADDMGGNFALEPLVRAQVTMFTDLRNPGAKTTNKLLGQLLRLVGGDRTQVNKKFKKARSERIFAKFIIAANDLMQFHDNSDAIFNRMLIARTPNSYVGREDITLDKRMITEISGILNWALQGLYRLQARGRFIEPKSTRHILGLMKASASPVGAFIDAHVKYNSQSKVLKDTLYEAFETYAGTHGLYDPGKDTFFRYFYANKSSAGEMRGSDETGRPYYVTGIELILDL